MQTGILAAGDGTVGPVVFGGDPYTYPTLVQVTADGIITRNYSNFPYLWWDNAGKPASPLDPGGEFIWSIYYQCVGNDIIQFINDDGSYGGYVGFCDAFNQLEPQSSWTSPWQVVTGRAQGSRNGGYAQARYSCGGPQDDPCYTYGGSQSITVTPASASLQLSADNAEIHEGDVVTFIGAISPDSVGGIQIPRAASHWTWQPDYDDVVASRVHLDVSPSRSTQSSSARHAPRRVQSLDSDLADTISAIGDDSPDDFSPLPPTVVCGDGPFTCSMAVYQSGTMTLTGIVNGTTVTTNSVHVTVHYECRQAVFYSYTLNNFTADSRIWGEFIDSATLFQPLLFSGTIYKLDSKGIPLGEYTPTGGVDSRGYVYESGFIVLRCRNWTTQQPDGSPLWHGVDKPEYANHHELHFVSPL